MRNSIRYYLSLFFLLLNLDLVAQELEINSSKMQYDNINKITIFEGNVNSSDEIGNKLFAEFAEYNKNEGIITNFKILELENILLNIKLKEIIYNDIIKFYKK